MDQYKNIGLSQGISGFFWQLFLGHSINTTVWYQINLIILTVIFIIIFRFMKPQLSLNIAIALGLFSLYFQYSGINGALFDNAVWPSNVNPNYIIYPIGRLCEMVPYAVIGVIICHYNILNRLRENKWKTIIVTAFLIYIFLTYSVFISPDGYGYSGIYKIVMGILSVFLFLSLPFDKFPRIITDLINYFSKYMMGIYFMHMLIAQVIYNSRLQKWFMMRPGSIYDCIIIYMVCLGFSWLFSRIPIKWLKDSVV